MATPAQIAARKKFAERARSGELAKMRKKATKRNPAKTVSEEISRQVRKGKPQKQAVAIALEMERAGKVKKNPDGKKFVVGKYYETRLITDSNTKVGALILDRTEKSVTVQGTDNLMKTKYRLTTDYQGNEMFFPYGRYSMAPQIGADDERKSNPTPTKARAVKSNPSKIKWTKEIDDYSGFNNPPQYNASYRGYDGTVFKEDGKWRIQINKGNSFVGEFESQTGTIPGAKVWLEIVADNEILENEMKLPKRNPTATRAPARSRTKLVSNGREKNPVKPKEMTVYQVQYRRPNMKLFEPWATVMYLPMAKDIARRLADDPIAKNWTIKVESIKVKS
jgi:hypothetical protein